MRSRFTTKVAISILTMLTTATISAQAAAWGRTVMINGATMNDTQLASLDRAHCMQIPDGSYFLTQSADGRLVWGYAAMPGIPQGYLGEECASHQTQQTGSYATGGYSGYTATEDYGKIYGGGVPTGDGTFEIYNGATGGFDYQ